ncbi:MAG: CDP-diacylglycerol--glycerol-3-phosphate 3-phosphatidyltransferase, partial [Bacteroidales bacterium]|nr:CDP-diacylglycerol--glycerol-3-phosphate 3-phosphatidyltransferase [Bacteroidales bacterium]
CLICAVLFIGTALTDMFDGRIARGRGLVTDFGKFLDPVADKFMVIGALFVILHKFEQLRTSMVFVLIIIVFRELAVTSMRLVVSTGEGIVIAANSLGKIKTVSQIVFICTVFLEPVVEFLVELLVGGADNNIVHGIYPLTWLTMIFTVVMTIWSGANYIAAYWKYLDPEK